MWKGRVAARAIWPPPKGTEPEADGLCAGSHQFWFGCDNEACPTHSEEWVGNDWVKDAVVQVDVKGEEVAEFRPQVEAALAAIERPRTVQSPDQGWLMRKIHAVGRLIGGRNGEADTWLSLLPGNVVDLIVLAVARSEKLTPVYVRGQHTGYGTVEVQKEGGWLRRRLRGSAETAVWTFTHEQFEHLLPSWRSNWRSQGKDVYMASKWYCAYCNDGADKDGSDDDDDNKRNCAPAGVHIKEALSEREMQHVLHVGNFKCSDEAETAAAAWARKYAEGLGLNPDEADAFVNNYLETQQ